MSRLRGRVVLGAWVAAAAVVALPASPAAALDCVDPADVAADATHVFAGTIAGGDERELVMDVSEVWSAGPVLEQVRLPLDPDMGIWYPWDVGSPPVDPDAVWVVATGDDFVVGPCGLWTQDLVRQLRPHRTHPPVRAIAEQVTGPPMGVTEPDEDPGRATSRLATTAAVGGMALAGAGAGAWWVRRHRLSRAGRPRR